MNNINEIVQIKALAKGLINTIIDIDEKGDLKGYEFNRQYDFIVAVLSAIITLSSRLIDELEQTKTPGRPTKTNQGNN